MTEIKCILCESKDYRVLYPSTIRNKSEKVSSVACTSDGHGEHYQVVSCNSCGFIFCSPLPEDQDILKEYEAVIDENYKQEIKGRVKTFNRNLNNLEKYVKPGTILDVGCSLGVFLNEAEKRGWKSDGIEPSQWCVEQSKKLYQLSIRQGTYLALKDICKKYDAVTIWDVIEHVTNPRDLIEKIWSVLKPNGIIAISTMDVSSLYARAMGKKWPWYMRMHLCYFSKKTIMKLLQETGFEILSIGKYHHIISYEYLLYKLDKVCKPIHAVLLFLKKIFSIKEAYWNICLGDFMEIYARKIEKGGCAIE